MTKAKSIPYKTDSWNVTFDGYDPEDEGRREALCALGNGYLMTRAATPEATADDIHHPGTYRAGLYNRLVQNIEGQNVEDESLVNLPNWLSLTFKAAGGDWFNLDHVKILSYRQTLDLRRGALYRQLSFKDQYGNETSLLETRFVSMAQPHLLALRIELRPENWSGVLEVRAGIGADVTNNLDKEVPYEERHLTFRESGRLATGGIWLLCCTTQSRSEIAVAGRTRVWLDSEPCARLPEGSRPTAGLEESFSLHVEEKQAVVIEKRAAVYTSRDLAISECGEAARQALEQAPDFSSLFAAHERSWDLLWGRCQLELSEPKPLLAARLHLFHVLQNASPHTAELDAGIPSRSWGEAYRGHIFWDELFVFPLLTFRIPALARSLLLYRYRRLNEARRLATSHGLRGAMFPWRSASTGREETPAFQPYPPSGHWLPDDTRLQRHIGAAVAHSVWTYGQATGDAEFMSDYGAELLLEVARFWASLATFNPERGRFEIHGVVGPDEYHTAYPDAATPGIDNNSYTNLMAVWTILRGIEALSALTPSRQAELCQLLALTQTELDHWEVVSRKMYIPFRQDGIIDQFEGFEQLQTLDLDAFQAEHGKTRVDWVLEAQGDTVNRYQVAKQADTLTLFFLLPEAEVKHLLERLGYAFDHETFKRTFDLYSAQTPHESSLSRIIHAGVLAHLDRSASWQLFEEAQFPDLAAVKSESTAQGVHLGAMAGTVYLLQHHYLGLTVGSDGLRLEPALPEALGDLSMGLRYRHNELRCDVTDRLLTVASAASNAEAVTLLYRQDMRSLMPGEQVSFDIDLQSRGLT